MPLYEYECVKCRQRTERIEKVTGPRLKKCPKCGEKVARVLTAASVQFKGGGWYVNDYAKKSAPSPDANAAKPETKAASDPKTTPAKESTPPAEKKTVKKE